MHLYALEPRHPAHAVPQHGAHVTGHDRGRRRPPHRGLRRRGRRAPRLTRDRASGPDIAAGRVPMRVDCDSDATRLGVPRGDRWTLYGASGGAPTTGQAGDAAATRWPAHCALHVAREATVIADEHDPTSGRRAPARRRSLPAGTGVPTAGMRSVGQAIVPTARSPRRSHRRPVVHGGSGLRRAAARTPGRAAGRERGQDPGVDGEESEASTRSGTGGRSRPARSRRRRARTARRTAS